MAFGAQIIKYGFATGRVRVLETKMVSLERVKRLIESANMDEVHRVLAETDYGQDMRSAGTIAEVEAALDKQLSSAYALLHESNIPLEMETYFRSRYDFLNLRALLKSGLGQQAEVLLSPLGAADIDTADLPEPLESAAQEALAKYNEDQRIEEIDIVLDRHYFANLLALAGKLKSKWITAYTKLLIDLANGRIAVRGGKEMIAGGDTEHLAEVMATVSSIAEYDLAADNAAIDWLVTSHRFNSGPEPVFAYVAAREHEVKLIRLIVLSHLSGVPAERIKDRVSRIYA
ncbi:MAG: V-type ATPase subunit [Actinomycetota bacterium]|nr:V-type ATPase subunit [Actinomycetota bacterium]